MVTATDIKPPGSDSRTISQRIGLVLGVVLFAGIIALPTMSGLADQTSELLNQPVNSAEVQEVARGAQCTLALVVLMVM